MPCGIGENNCCIPIRSSSILSFIRVIRVPCSPPVPPCYVSSCPPCARCVSVADLRAADKPNVVLIVIDDLGQRDLGCYGSTFYKTPNIDQHGEGRAALHRLLRRLPGLLADAGEHPHRPLPAAHEHHRLDPRPQGPARPAPQAARDPQRTAAGGSDHRRGAQEARATPPRIIGKWHLGGTGFEPEKQGFDVNIAGDQTGTPRSYFAPFENKLGKMPGLEKAEAGEYLTDRLAPEAEKFIEANKDKPFFLYLPHYAVHTPLRAKQAIIDKYKVKPKAGQPEQPRLRGDGREHGRGGRPRAEEARRPEAQPTTRSSSSPATTAASPPPRAARPARPSTARCAKGRASSTKAGFASPCIMKWPGKIKPGTTTDQVACSIDFFDTILEATQANRTKPEVRRAQARRRLAACRSSAARR